MLAEMATEIEASRLLCLHAAWEKDNNLKYDVSSAVAKLYAAEKAMKITTDAVQIHGGYGFVKEYHVERLLRESLIPKLAPVSAQMILNYISERVLGLPKSY